MLEKNYDHLATETKLRQKWADEQIYSLENNPGPLFSVDTPPPTVSGALHIGHVFSYTQADIINRYKRLQGFSVFYPMGFDDNGLATERFVEKKLAIRAQDLTRAEFTELCLRETKLAADSFRGLWERLGLSVNWEACYSTISPLARKIAQESFMRLYQAGHVYRKQEPALYCTTCQTSVAQAELEDQTVPATFNQIKFTLAARPQAPVIPSKVEGQGAQDKTVNNSPELIIATTRPEFLSSCVALFYHPEDPRYQYLKDQKNAQALVPIFNYTVPILPDPLVNPEKGTGLVMCCTFGDKTDIAWYQKFKLPYRPSIDLRGRWLAATGPLAGMKAPEARAKVLELLQAENCLLNQTPLTHSVNTHERCKKAIEYVELSQWFIKILDHKAQFLKVAQEINWYPQFMQVRYRDWVENLSWDWCISRQRFYGIPFPAWHCQDCQQIILPKISDLPVDPQDPADLARCQLTSCPGCHGTNLKPDTDVMDTWNTSSLTPQICYSLWAQNSPTANQPANTNPLATAGQAFEPNFTKQFLPMSLRPQAHDIIRTWAFDTIVKSYFHFEQIPWHNIMISGHVLSSEQEKLSKSKANSKIEPENLLNQYSADTVRYWTASGNLGGDIAFSENQLKIGGRLVTKLWNAFRFSAEHLSTDFIPETQAEFTARANTNLELVHQWILHQATSTFKQYQNYLDKYEFGLALQTVEKFFWSDFCDNYLELIKNQLFNPQDYNPNQLIATKNTLYHVGLRILQLYAPYLPYITEELYLNIYAKHCEPRSLHQTKFSTIQLNFDFTASAQLMGQLNNLIAQVRKLKSAHQLSLKTSLTEIVISCDPQQAEQLKPHAQLLRGVTQAAKVSYTCEKFNTPALIQTNDTWSAQLIFDYSESE